MDEGEQQRSDIRWGLVLQSGMVQRLTPRTDEQVWVTDAFIVDAASADVGQCDVDACVQIGARNVLLASLSAERPCAELQTPVSLDEKFILYVSPRGGDGSDTDDAGAVVVQFGGYLLVLLSPDSDPE